MYFIIFIVQCRTSWQLVLPKRILIQNFHYNSKKSWRKVGQDGILSQTIKS